MTSDPRLTIGLTVVAIDPPCTAEHGVMFGLQRGRDVDDPILAADTTRFECDFEIIPDGAGGYDFRGEYVHGKKGDRFLYLSWGLADPSEPFFMFARAKIKLAGIPADMLSRAQGGERLECRLEATNHKGQPSSGTIKNADLDWSTRP